MAQTINTNLSSMTAQRNQAKTQGELVIAQIVTLQPVLKRILSHDRQSETNPPPLCLRDTP